MMSNNPLQKLNKRMIYGCLLLGSSIIIPVIVFSTLPDKKAHASMPSQKMAMQAHNNANDAFNISGTERFPENYGELKKFENEINEHKPPSEEKLLEAMANAEMKRETGPIKQAQTDGYYHHANRDDPWREARKREEKQQAFDHYDSKRSDILFIDNGNNKKRRAHGPDDGEQALAENSGEMGERKSDVFFLNKKRGQDIGRIKEALPFMISQGTLIPALLQTEIDTTLPGPILARVSHNIWDSKSGKTLLIPQNSTLVGEYNANVSSGQARAQIVWNRIIFPNQQSISLGSMVGVDKKGTSGTEGSVDNHYDKVALALLMTTALGAGVRMNQGKYDPNSASIAQDLGNSLAQETARLGNKITDKMLAIPPTIKVPMGQRLNVFVEQDLSLQPYAG